MEKWISVLVYISVTYNSAQLIFVEFMNIIQ